VKGLAHKATGNKIQLLIYVTPETYEEIDRRRGTLKKSTYACMVLEELFNPEIVTTKPDGLQV